METGYFSGRNVHKPPLLKERNGSTYDCIALAIEYSQTFLAKEGSRARPEVGAGGGKGAREITVIWMPGRQLQCRANCPLPGLAEQISPLCQGACLRIQVISYTVFRVTSYTLLFFKNYLSEVIFINFCIHIYAPIVCNCVQNPISLCLHVDRARCLLESFQFSVAKST